MNQGGIWIPKAEFFDDAGEPADPTEVTAKIREPDGTIATRGPYPGAEGGPDLEREALGVFTTNVTLSAAGEWNARWEGTGVVQAASPDQSIDVADSVFYEPYRLLCSVDSVIKELKLTDKQPDRERIEQTIEAASQAIMTAAGREFYAAGTQFEERVVPVDASYGFFPIADAAEIEDVVPELLVDETSQELPFTWQSYPVSRDPMHPITGLGLSRSPGTFVTVSARWGWPFVAADIREAAVKQAAAWYGLDSSRLSDSWGDELSQAGAALRATGSRSLLKVVRDLIRPYRYVAMA